MWHGKSKAVYQKEIANLRSKVLSYHTTQYYSNVNEKKQQKKQKKVIFFLKEDRQDHGLFVKKIP